MSNPNPMPGLCRECNAVDGHYQGCLNIREPSNPNPMNSRCGLEDCDCGYTIGRLTDVFEAIADHMDDSKPDYCPLPEVVSSLAITGIAIAEEDK